MTLHCFNNDIYHYLKYLAYYSLFLFFFQLFPISYFVIMDFYASELSGTCKVKVVDTEGLTRVD